MSELKLRHFRGSNVYPREPKTNGIADQILHVIKQMKITPAYYDSKKFSARWDAEHGYQKKEKE